MRETAVASAAGFLAVSASVLNFLNYHQYPLWRPEIGLVALAVLVTVAAMALLYLVSGRLGRVLLQHFLVFIALDLNFGMIVAVLGMAVVAIVFRQRMLAFVGVAAGAVLFMELAGLSMAMPESSKGAGSAVPESHAPLLVHLVLDEHIGIEGLIGETPEATVMREKLLAFYRERGFRLYGGAYSRSFHTVNSIPEMLNLGTPPEVDDRNLSTNAWFDRLGALGYGIHVWQTDFLQYCDNGFVVSCHTRRAYDVGDLADLPVPAVVKAETIVKLIIGQSELLGNLLGIGETAASAARSAGLPIPTLKLRPHPAAIGAFNTFDDLSRAITASPPGNAYFVHELTPHHPYLLTADCEVKPYAEWLDRRGDPDERPTRERAYFEQVECLMHRLDRLLSAVDRSPQGRNAIVIIHGDHGSRITDIDPKFEVEGKFSDADLVRSYSTLFAVRAPAVNAGYVERRLPVALLLRSLIESHFEDSEPPLNADFAHDIVLDDRHWNPAKSYPLPDWWIDPP